VESVAEFAVKARVSNGKLEEMVRPTRESLGNAANAMSSKSGTN
jgi:hypothetical protein